jgi:hypothetical protein
MQTRNGIVYADDPAPLTRVAAVRALDNYRLWLRFATGEEKIFDFKPELKYPAFRPLADVGVFDSVYLNMGTVMWNDGSIDISPDHLLLESLPAPEDSLAPAERARPLVDTERGYGNYYREGEFIDNMDDKEFDAFLNGLARAGLEDTKPIIMEGTRPLQGQPYPTL